MKRFVFAATMVILVVMISGCVKPNIIRTEPPGAKIFVDGKYIGDSPRQFVFDRPFRFSYFIEAKLDGYFDEAFTARSHTDFWGNVTWDDVYMRLQRK